MATKGKGKEEPRGPLKRGPIDRAQIERAAKGQGPRARIMALFLRSPKAAAELREERVFELIRRIEFFKQQGKRDFMAATAREADISIARLQQLVGTTAQRAERISKARRKTTR